MTSFTWGDPDPATWGEPLPATWGVGPPSAPENLTATAVSDSKIDLLWDNVGAIDGINVYRARSASANLADYTQIASLGTVESYSDTGLTNGREYHYRVTARNAVGESDPSSDAFDTTDLPAPDLATATTTIREVDLSATLNDNNDDGELRFIRDGGATVATITDLSDFTATDTGLLDGTEYDYTAERDTGDAVATSAVVPTTTILPDEDAPILGNGVEDEVAVDRESGVTNTGDVRYQLRRSEDAPDWDTAGSFQQFIGNFDTLTFEFVGLLDGEKYEVRGRTETADATGEFTDPVSIVTQFPGFANFQITDTRADAVDLEWEDRADNEDGTRVQRRAIVNGSFTPWDTIATVPPTSGDTATVTYTDTSVPSGLTVQYRIQPFTPYTSVTSDAEQTTIPGDTRQNVAAEGYHVEVVNPDTGRVRVPEVADLQNAPVVNPGPNQQPRARIPVRKNDVWLSDAYDDDPEMRVWRDGRRLPIEVLRNVEQTEGATILVGVGGVELEQRVTDEFSDARRHEAAESLIEDATDYAADTPDPETPTLTDQVQQAPSTDAEFEAVREFPNDGLVTLDGDSVKGVQVAYTTDDNTGNDTSQALTSDDYSGGEARSMQDTGDTIEYDFTLDHDIPQDEVKIQVREDDGEAAGLGEGSVAWTAYLNGGGITGGGDFGVQIGSFGNPGGNIVLGWADLGFIYGDETIGEAIGTDLLEGFPYTLTFECDDGGDLNDAYAVDVIAPYDARAESQLSFPNTVNSPGGALDGPGHYVAQDAVFDDAVSAFNVVAGAADVTMPDTSGNQRVQVSNDRGDTYLPNDGSESNTTSIDVDFPSPGSRIRLRVTLDGYEPSGVRSTTPARNYATQTLDAYELRADVSQELLLIDEPVDTSLADALTTFAEPAERSWRFAYDDGTPTVRFVQNGQFTGDFTPEYSERSREKLGKTYERVTVKGSNEPVSNEPYTASTTFQPLVRNDILTGSETVYDDTTNYERGDDYEMRYRDGEIRALPAGDLVPGNDYRIDYRYQAEGTYEVADASADPPELVETVPGVTSERLAEQVAYVLATETDTPRYAAEVVIPDPDPRFDPTDALPPSALGLPAGVGALEVRGEPQLTETGLAVRFGTRPPVEATQERLSRQLGRVSDRS